jgi:DNA sulfur modification protein DndB
MSTLVSAVKGQMGNTVYYLASVPFGVAVKLFTHDPSEDTRPSSERHQRKLNLKRVPEVANYITESDDFVFSSVVVSTPDTLVYTEQEEDDVGTGGGTLMLPLDAEWHINDGQHRLAGINEALRLNPQLRHDTLPVMILPDAGLVRSQQVFSDLNRTAQKTSRTLDILYDRRTPLNRITAAVVSDVPIFRDRTDTEHANVSARSEFFTTLAAVQAANTDMLGDLPHGLPEELERQACEFAIWYWTFITPYIKPWADIIEEKITPPDARAEYLSCYAIALRALGSVGKQFAGGDTTALQALQAVNWRKDNPEWQGVCMQGSTVLSRGPERTALSNFLAQRILFAPTQPGKQQRRRST